MAVLLDIANLSGGYGGRPIVEGVSFTVQAGEVVTMIGHNGAGKSTVLKSIFNMLPVRGGTVRLGGRDMRGLAPPDLLRQGLAYVPQHHSIFPRLTIAENLRMGGYLIRDPALLAQRIEQVSALFPLLANRAKQMAGSLSGGEQRMLEIARTLLLDPQVVMLDEPSIGLAPRMVDAVFDTVQVLKGQGKAVLMVEQNVRKGLLASDRGMVLELGKIALSDSARNLIDDERVAALYMGKRAEA